MPRIDPAHLAGSGEFYTSQMCERERRRIKKRIDPKSRSDQSVVADESREERAPAVKSRPFEAPRLATGSADAQAIA